MFARKQIQTKISAMLISWKTEKKKKKSFSDLPLPSKTTKGKLQLCLEACLAQAAVVTHQY